jgi:hypothetical protein
MVAMEHLLIAIGEQDERYASEHYGAANACAGSRFLEGWQRRATQPFGGRKRRRRAAAKG